MKEQLFASASEWCEKSIESYLNNNEQQFFVQAGVAFELLGKSFLSSYHPSLIVDGFDSLLQVCGAVAHSKRKPGNLITIGASEVLKRVIQILPQLKSYEAQLTELAHLRNGVVHLGNSAIIKLPEITRVYLQANMILIEACGQTPPAFFKDQTEFVQKLLDDSIKETEQLVAQKIARARLKYKERHGNSDQKIIEAQQELFLNIMNAQYTRVCPACQNTGEIMGEYEIEWENLEAPFYLPNELLYINRFECRLCDLILIGRDEIIAAKLPEKIDMEAPRNFQDFIDSEQE
jgi:hypothetical protein